MKHTFKSIAIACTLAITASSAFAAFPDGKPITIVVPFAAGGPTDKVARDLAQAMRKQLPGSTFVIENLAGSGSTIGSGKVARATPDGHTLLLNHTSMATIPAMFRRVTFNTLSDFEYLGIVNDVPMTLLSRPNMPVNDIRGLLSWLDGNSGQVSLGNAGLGSASHLCGMLLQQAVRENISTVPYKGTAPALKDLTEGKIDLLCDQTTNTLDAISKKSVKAYAVTTENRLDSLPNLPTLKEAGLRNFNLTIWHGLYAPKGTPAQVITTLNTALKKALKDEEFIRSQVAMGAVVATDSRIESKEHKAFVDSEIKKLGSAIRAASQYAD